MRVWELDGVEWFRRLVFRIVLLESFHATPSSNATTASTTLRHDTQTKTASKRSTP